jgi:AraC family transcriptional activator of pobA
MDDRGFVWHYHDMQSPIPAWQLYGENRVFPDLLHIERITDRAAGLDWVIAPHRHLHLHQVFLIASGDAVLEADGTRHVLATPGLISLPRGVVHSFAFAKGTEGYVLTVPVQEFPALFGEAAPLAAAAGHFRLGRADEATVALFGALHAEYQGSGPLRNALVAALAVQIICQALRDLVPTGAAPPAQDARLARFDSLILAHLRQKWQVADYARALGLSPRHLSRLCQAATGLTAARQIEAATFREARRLLVYTRMPVAAVGYHLGFDDPSYFSRAFQRHAGLAPAAYRARFEG